MRASFAIALLAVSFGSALGEEKPPTYQAPAWAQNSKALNKQYDSVAQSVLKNFQNQQKDAPALRSNAQNSFNKVPQNRDAATAVNRLAKGYQDTTQSLSLANKNQQRSIERSADQAKKALNEQKEHVQAQQQKYMQSQELAKKEQQRSSERNIEQQNKDSKASTDFMKNFQAKQEENFKNAAGAFKKAQEKAKESTAKNFEAVGNAKDAALKAAVKSSAKHSLHMDALGTAKAEALKAWHNSNDKAAEELKLVHQKNIKDQMNKMKKAGKHFLASQKKDPATAFKDSHSGNLVHLRDQHQHTHPHKK